MSSNINAWFSPRTRWGALLAVGAAILLGTPPVQGHTASPLAFFKSYFVTGDYVVGGASLWRRGVNGVATSSIPMSGSPASADILAAFLYVQTAEKIQWSGIDHATFDGNDLGPGATSVAKALNWQNATPTCWSVAWPGSRRLVTYRADVLRFLPTDTNGNIIVNGSHTIQIPDSGLHFDDDDQNSIEHSSWSGPRAIGASLVVVYRDPTKPLKAIVFYDGGFTKGPFDTMTQNIAGFYEASTVNPSAKMTHLVGDGSPFFGEKLSLDGQPVAVNPFASTAGPKWDNPTFNVTGKLAGDAASTTVSVSPYSRFPDCLSWSGIVFSTTVQDTDGDGLLDRWEESAATIYDPNGQPLPNLAAMGANKNHKDLFVEIDYMTAAAGTTYGGVPKPQHSHLPTEAALTMVGDAFKNAPIANPDLVPGINVHFDVGHTYQDSPYVLPASLARGGESIDEMATVCTRGPSDPPYVCQFSTFPGTVGWKTGFQFLRDQLINTPPPLEPDGDDPCDVPGNDGPGAPCERRFDSNRMNMFHYALFAHAPGLPVAACQNGDGTADTACQQTNPDFHVPRTNSGVGDFPGADLIVTLGGFPDASGLPVGTPFMQGATLMHELGHTFELTHAGPPLPATLPKEPNCKPNYLSVMNYLFQLRGLYNDTDPGMPHMDFSGEVLAGIDETNLSDGPLSGSARYHTGWYAPQGPGTFGSPAQRFCNGLDFPVPKPAPMVRVDSASVTGPIDWNQNGDAANSAFTQDINFDGLLTPLNPGANDWTHLHLNQIGARRNVGGSYIDGSGNLILGPLSLDVGRADIGRGDIGRADIGRADIGSGDYGRGDIGSGDIGRADIGRGDIGRADIGEAAGEIDFDIATASGNSPPNGLTACVIGAGCSGATTPFHRIRLTWQPPTVGSVFQYTVYRVKTGDPITSRVLVGQTPSVLGAGSYSLVDTQELPNALFSYLVVAEFNDGPPHTLSGPSNVVTILAINDPPVAVNDSYTTNQNTALTVTTPGTLGNGVLANDTDTDSPHLTAARVAGPSHGTLTLNADGTFTYTPATGYSGTDSFTYTAHDIDPSRSSNVATVTITVIAVGYEFVNVKNLPPPPGVTFRTDPWGTLVDLEWRFKKNGVVVDSHDAKVSISIQSPSGAVKTYTPSECDGFAFEYNPWTKTWDFDWNPRNPAPGTYYVIVRSAKTGQQFPASGPGFPIVFKRW